MADQQMIAIPQFTVAEAEQTIYGLDEVTQALHRAIAGNAGEPISDDLRADCQEVLNAVESARNKIHTSLTKAGVKLDYQLN